MKKHSLLTLGLGLILCLNGCSNRRTFVDKAFGTGERQYQMMLDRVDISEGFPRTVDGHGNVKTTDVWDWTGGFFPGGLWYLYEYTQNPAWKAAAEKWTEALEQGQFLVQHHDVGFVMYCSYGNAVRLEKDTAKVNKYNSILIQSAESALTRFNSDIGLIKSWNNKKSWDGKTMWTFPVIIDNMMNLELLFYVSKLTNDPKYRQAAISHADKTMEHHFREDYSTYHVVDYDSISGKPLHKQTNQGYADNSTWSRGQAWAIYGYTLMYRETQDPKYLDQAIKVADFFLDHPNLPEDKIPYWDFNVGQEGYLPDWDYTGKIDIDNIPRDASAASVAASALLELSTFSKQHGSIYFEAAEKMLKSLSGEDYLATPGSNAAFILKHSTGSFPHNSEIDVPLIYADYYYLEALLRYEKLATGEPISQIN